MLSVGTVINERYKLEAVIGEGGMGVVFEATHLGLGRTVAVKVVRGGQSDGADAAARLVREARVVGTLRSPHVAHVLDVGEHEGEPFLVMERLHGRTVHDLVRAEGALGVEQVAALVIQACHALDDAHRHGIVHRDVKPSNMFLVADETDAVSLKIIDFGISKSLPIDADGSHNETKTGTLLGSPSFMSPEQIRSSKDVDARTDIWSLGIVMYFLLTAKKPFEAESLLDLMTSVVHETPPRLRAIRPDVPDAVERVVLRCLAKDREDRYATAAELAHALAPFAPPVPRDLALAMPLDRGPVSSNRAPSSRKEIMRGTTPERPPASDPNSETLTASVTASLRTPGARPSTRTRTVAVVAIGVVLLGAGGALAFAQHARRSLAAAAATTTAPATAEPALGSLPSVASAERSPAPSSSSSAARATSPPIIAGGAASAAPPRRRPHVAAPARPPSTSPQAGRATQPPPATGTAPPEIPKTPD
ncbi:MAG: eukaryotic-like serine/threonine-protein kinase [Myxococcales bacterium]|jgi:serine/threonine-protein kinase|nr:eukaryotic-like serine/threonine-protein kinase [Myxococcales bacterium]